MDILKEAAIQLAAGKEVGQLLPHPVRTPCRHSVHCSDRVRLEKSTKSLEYPVILRDRKVSDTRRIVAHLRIQLLGSLIGNCEPFEKYLDKKGISTNLDTRSATRAVTGAV